MIPFNLLPEDRRQSSFPGPGLRRFFRTCGVLGLTAGAWLWFVEIPRAEELQASLDQEVQRLEPEASRADELARGNARLRADRAARQSIEAGRRDLPPYLVAIANAVGRAREASGSEIVLSHVVWTTGPEGPSTPITLEGIAYSSRLGDVELLREELGQGDVFGAVGPAETNWRSPAGREGDEGWEFHFEVGFRVAEEPPADEGAGATEPPEAPAADPRVERVAS